MIGELAAVSAALCWAISPILYKKALIKVDPLEAGLVRIISAAAFLFLFVARDLNSFLQIDIWNLALITIGVILMVAVGDILYLYGLSKVSVSLGTPLSSSYPLYAVAFAYLLMNEPVRLEVALGAAAVVAGTWLLSAGKGRSREPGESSWRGILALVSAAPSWGLSFVIFKAVVSSSNLIQVSALRMLVASPVLLAMVVASGKGRHLKSLGRREVAMLSVAGVLDHGVGGILILLSLALTEASKVALLSSIYPLFTVVLALALLKEKATPRLLTGTGLVVLGVCLVSLS